jgi:hypothetical protein
MTILAMEELETEMNIDDTVIPNPVTMGTNDADHVIAMTLYDTTLESIFNEASSVGVR